MSADQATTPERSHDMFYSTRGLAQNDGGSGPNDVEVDGDLGFEDVRHLFKNAR